MVPRSFRGHPPGRSKSGIQVRNRPNCPFLGHHLTASASRAATLELKSEKANAHSEIIWSVAFSPGGKTIVSGSSDKTIKVWELRDQPVGE
eukprot:5264575-Prymnesium_polylepis.1